MGVRWPAPLSVAAALLLTGCAGADLRGGPPAATAVATVTETVTVTASPTAAAEVDPTPSQTSDPVTAPAPRLRLRVFRDGCGVIRSQAQDGVSFQNLTWVFRDQDGFEVLGRNAEGETRYRYFTSGTYTVALEAWAGDRYAPVSNRVTVHC
jgi:hypothetical protein